MITNFEIKPATINDAQTIVDLIKAIAEYEKLSDQVQATPEKEARLEAPRQFWRGKTGQTWWQERILGHKT